MTELKWKIEVIERHTIYSRSPISDDGIGHKEHEWSLELTIHHITLFLDGERFTRFQLVPADEAKAEVLRIISMLGHKPITP